MCTTTKLIKKSDSHLLFLKQIKSKIHMKRRPGEVISNRVQPTPNSTLIRRLEQLQKFAANMCVGGAKRSNHTSFVAQMERLKMDKKVFLLLSSMCIRSRTDKVSRLLDALPYKERRAKPQLYNTTPTPTTRTTHPNWPCQSLHGHHWNPTRERPAPKRQALRHANYALQLQEKSEWFCFM